MLLPAASAHALNELEIGNVTRHGSVTTISIPDTESGHIVVCIGYDADGKIVGSGKAGSDNLATMVEIRHSTGRMETFRCAYN